MSVTIVWCNSNTLKSPHHSVIFECQHLEFLLVFCYSRSEITKPYPIMMWNYWFPKDSLFHNSWLKVNVKGHDLHITDRNQLLCSVVCVASDLLPHLLCLKSALYKLSMSIQWKFNCNLKLYAFARRCIIKRHSVVFRDGMNMEDEWWNG